MGALLDGGRDILFSNHCQPPGAFPVTRRYPKQLHTSRHPAQWNAGSHFAHLDTAPGSGKITQPQCDPRRRCRPHLREQNKLLSRNAALHNGFIIDHRRPRSDGMQDASPGGRPRQIHRADPTIANHPARIRPTIGQHLPNPLSGSRNVSSHRHGHWGTRGRKSNASRALSTKSLAPAPIPICR